MSQSDHPSRVIVVGQTAHVRWNPDFSEAVFLSDGTKVPGVAQHSLEQLVTARSLYYRGDDRTAVREMCWEHEVVHSLLAKYRGFPVSTVLWDVAHRVELEQFQLQQHWQEEAQVLSLQRFLNTRDHNIDPGGYLSSLSFEFSLIEFLLEATDLLRKE